MNKKEIKYKILNNLQMKFDTFDSNILKIYPEYYNDVVNNGKRFDLRLNDRYYKTNDIYYLCEYENNEFTGNFIKIKITYVMDNYYILNSDYCIFSFIIV